VTARPLGVEALSSARAKDCLCGRLVLRLAFKLLIRALLECLNSLEGTALLDPNLALLGGHRPPFYGLRTSSAGASRATGARVDMDTAGGILAACRLAASHR
jgi:hypothetical protein